MLNTGKTVQILILFLQETPSNMCNIGNEEMWHVQSVPHYECIKQNGRIQSHSPHSSIFFTLHYLTSLFLKFWWINLYHYLSDIIIKMTLSGYFPNKGVLKPGWHFFFLLFLHISISLSFEKTVFHCFLLPWLCPLVHFASTITFSFQLSLAPVLSYIYFTIVKSSQHMQIDGILILCINLQVFLP